MEALYRNKFEAIYPNQEVTSVTLSNEEIEELETKLAMFISLLKPQGGFQRTPKCYRYRNARNHINVLYKIT